MLTQRKLTTSIILTVLALAALNHSPVQASDTYYVAPGGNDSWNCLSETTACRTIQAAINKAASADYILVASGTYSGPSNGESFPINISKSIIIHGSGRGITIVDAMDSTKNVISAGGNNINVYIDGFTIQGGYRGIELIGYYPGYISGVISDNQITGNEIGIYTFLDNYGTIQSNDISGNRWRGIYNEESGPTISRNIFGFNGNGYISAAIYNYHSSPSIVNNIMGWNNGSGVYNEESSPTIINNTISFNTSISFNDGGSGVANFNGSNPTIMNNIITSNPVYGIHAQSSSFPIVSYNDVWGNGWLGYGDFYGTSGGTGGISADPRFVSFFDAHLLCSSPAINTGNPNAELAPPNDYDELPRPMGGRVDMGAYEKQADLFCPIYIPFIYS